MLSIKFRSAITAITVAILCLVSLAGAEEKKENIQEGYRIEVAVDTIQEMRLQEREVRFVSPSGKVIKRIEIEPIKLRSPKHEGWLFYAESPVKISGNMEYALEITKVKENGQWIRIEEVLWNAQGKKKWTKEWKTYLHEAEGDPNWDQGISYDGSKVYISYKDSLKGYWIAVYDTLGNEITKVRSNHGFRDISIAPDGRIIIAHTGMSMEDRQGYTGDYLFFYSVAEAKIKIVKAWGENWSAGGSPLEDGKVQLSLGEYPRSVILTFDEIPDDLSTLFLDGGEE